MLGQIGVSRVRSTSQLGIPARPGPLRTRIFSTGTASRRTSPSPTGTGKRVLLTAAGGWGIPFEFLEAGPGLRAVPRLRVYPRSTGPRRTATCNTLLRRARPYTPWSPSTPQDSRVRNGDHLHAELPDPGLRHEGFLSRSASLHCSASFTFSPVSCGASTKTAISFRQLDFYSTMHSGIAPGAPVDGDIYDIQLRRGSPSTSCTGTSPSLIGDVTEVATGALGTPP